MADVICYFPWAPEHPDRDGGWRALLKNPQEDSLGQISMQFTTEESWLQNQGFSRGIREAAQANNVTNIKDAMLSVEDTNDGRKDFVPVLIREAIELGRILGALQNEIIFESAYRLRVPSIYEASVNIFGDGFNPEADFEGQTTLDYLLSYPTKNPTEADKQLPSIGMSISRAVDRLKKSYPRVLNYDPVPQVDRQNDSRARVARNLGETFTGDYYKAALDEQSRNVVPATFRKRADASGNSSVLASRINGGGENNIYGRFRQGQLDPTNATIQSLGTDSTDRIRFVYFSKFAYNNLKKVIDQEHRAYIQALEEIDTPTTAEAEQAVQVPGASMSGVSSNFSKPKDLDPERRARMRILNGQMILLRHLTDTVKMASLTKNHSSPKVDDEFVKTEKLINYIGEPEALINLVNSPIRGAEQFINARNAELSTLVPKMTFFLVNKKGDRRKIEFPDHVHEYQIKALAKGKSSKDIDAILRKRTNHGTDAGVRSFSWDFQNRNVGEYVITANLSLFFGSALDLLNDDYSSFLYTTGQPTFNAGKIANGRIKKSSTAEKFKKVEIELKKRQDKLADLKQDPPKEDKEGKIDRFSTRNQSFPFPGAESYQLVVRVGWAFPDGKLPRGIDSEFVESIRRSQRELKLNLTGYDVDYSQNGQLTLNLSYAGSIDNALDHLVKADVLSVAGQTDQDEYEISKFVIPVPEDTVEQELDRTLASTYALKAWPRGYIRRKSVKDFDPEKKSYNTDDILDTVSLAKEGVEYELRTIDLCIRSMQERIAVAKKKYGDKGRTGGGLNAVVTVPGDGTEGTKKELIERWKGYRRVAQIALDNVMEQIREPKYAAILDRLLSDKKIYYGRIKERNDQLTAGALGVSGANKDKKVGRPTPSYEVSFTPQQPEKNESAKDRKQRILKALSDSRTGSAIPIARIDPVAIKRKDVDPVFGSRNIYYIRLGDLIDTVLKNLPANEEKDDDFKVILGCIRPYDLGIPGFTRDNTVALADIPISLEYFGQFFIKTVVASQRDFLSLREFLVSLQINLLSPMFREIAKKEGKSAPVFNFTTLFSALDLTEGTTVDRNELIQLTTERSQASAAKGRYLIMGPRQVTLDSRFGIEADDLANGIYHLKIGTDRGIVKSFSFSEMNLTSYYRTMQVEKSNNADGFLVVPQNIELTLYGNQFFPNGTMVYIDADVGFGRAIAKKLGIGGYYTVIRSVHSISAGKYETVLSCRFESAGNMD
jgi:hypothetical protein